MAETPRINLALTTDADAHSIKVPPPGRLTLSPEARRRLVEGLPSDDNIGCLTGDLFIDDPDDADWRRLEDALLEILMPVRYITGVTPARRAIREDTQANEVHGLTPLPLHEQVPGAWNFKEPRP